MRILKSEFIFIVNINILLPFFRMHQHCIAYVKPHLNRGIGKEVKNQIDLFTNSVNNYYIS
jgi:hypothetical protein